MSDAKLPIEAKMQTLMYMLTKNAARNSYADFLEGCGISNDEYKQIKQMWLTKLGVVPYV